MSKKQYFKKQYSRLAKEGVIKALIFGLIVGFIASLITAFITYTQNMSGLILSIVIGLAAVLLTTPLFFFSFFRPKTKQIAERVDRLGLEERLITMLELENDESFIALRQREDAKEKLSRVNSKQIKFSIFKIPVIALLIVATCSITMITVSATNVDPMMGWTQPNTLPAVEQEYFIVNYIVDSSRGFTGGYILGETDQQVAKVYKVDDEGKIIKDSKGEDIFVGQDATTVKAVADYGYRFVMWSDGNRNAERTDRMLTDDLVLFAYFE